MTQPLQTVGHDSIQYHFFCDGKVFAFRIFRTDTLEHSSAWIYDGNLREVLSTASPVTQGDADHLDVTSAAFSLTAGRDRGALRVRAGNQSDSFTAQFTIPRSFEWGYDALVPEESVTHQPDLDCEIQFRGERLRGTGYHKRYFWHKPPRYWGYRFLHGLLDDGSAVIWTADAVFGTAKYDYFKILDRAGGGLREAANGECAHKTDRIFAYLDGLRHEVVFEQRGLWQTALRSGVMDSHMRQQVVRMSWTAGGESREGIALTEYCFGTLG